MSRKGKVIVSVINDLSSDQRVHKTCVTLQNNGWEVLLVGRYLKNSLPLKRPYVCHRMKLLFTKGALFYAEYNIRLFLLLLFKKYNVLHSNDLDTLLANYLVHCIKGGELVYDSHEYFTEVPELENNKLAKNTWQRIESWIVPKLTHLYTVNKSIANLFKEKYNKEFGVVRNVPFLNNDKSSDSPSKTNLDLPEDKKILLIQGAGINIDRGAEEMVEAMKFIDNSILLIVGTGDVIPHLKNYSKRNNLDDKVVFTGRLPFEELKQITNKADLGLTLDKDTNINYKYSLPNKLFDYIHSDVPVLGSDLIEIKSIIDHYQVGFVLKSHDPKDIAEQINNIFADPIKLNQCKLNCIKAKEDLNWTNEEQVILNIYNSF